MGILRKLCHSTRWKAVFFILSVLICVVSTFFYAFSHPFSQSSDSVWNRLNQIQEEYPPGSSFTGAYRGATQCFGFAGYVFHALYGCDMPNSYYRDTWYQLDGTENLSVVGQLTQKNISKTALERLLSQGRPGDIIQYGTPHYPHTMVLLQTITEGFTVYDCNYDRQCTVMVRQVSYEALAAEIGSSSAQCGLTLYRANLKE